MEISPLGQAYLLLLCVLFGLSLGAFYDLFRAVRYSVLSKRAAASAIRFVGDFLLPVSAGAGIIILCYYFNKGELRFFAVLGLAAGFFLWRAAASRIFTAAVRRIIRALFDTVRFVSAPLVKLFKYLVNAIKKTIYFMHKVLEKKANSVYNISMKRAILKKSRGGFIKERKK